MTDRTNSDGYRMRWAGSQVGFAAARGWAIPPYPGFSVTRIRPRGQWTTGISPAHKMHLIDKAFAVWSPDPNPFAAVRTVCGQAHVRVQFHPDPDPHKKICEACTGSSLGRYVVYRFYDANWRLLYVGFTSDLTSRLRKHSRPGGSEWWPDVASRRFEFFQDRVEALAAERRGIQEEHPVHNEQHVAPAVTRG